MPDKVFSETYPPSHPPGWILRSAWVVGALILVALIVIVLRLGELENFVRLVEQARPGWLFLGLLLQFLTFVSIASAWRATLSRTRHPMPLSRLTSLGFAKHFTDQTIPSMGVSGNILVAKGLFTRGVPAHLTLTAILMDIIGYYSAYMIMVLTTLFILRAHYHASLPLLSAFALFAALAIGIPTLIVWLKRRGKKPLPRLLAHLPFVEFLMRIIGEVPSGILRDPVLILKNTFFEAGVFLLDAATFWVLLLSIGQSVSPVVPFTAYITAAVVGTISPLPTGLGTFEAVAVAILGLLKVPLEAALTATLLLRGYLFWLPMIPGLIMVKGVVGKKSISN